MTATIGDVRRSLADAIAAGTSLDEVRPYPIRQINAPCVHVRRGPMDPRMVLQDAKHAYLFIARLYVPDQDTEEAEQAIDVWCSPSDVGSIRGAVENSALWTCTVDYAQVTGIGDTLEPEVAGVPFKTVDFTIEVVW